VRREDIYGQYRYILSAKKEEKGAHFVHVQGPNGREKRAIVLDSLTWLMRSDR
jgi:hypothetical protein